MFIEASAERQGEGKAQMGLKARQPEPASKGCPANGKCSIATRAIASF
jgi:hypothetical protein